jgi:lysylphosphatidylglycerol synthetase-like protein (DUF2156 family)
MLGRQTYRLHEAGTMTVQTNRSASYWIALLPVGLSAVFMLAGRWIVGLAVLILSATVSLVVLRRASAVLEVHSNELRYRRSGVFGVRSTTAPRSAFAAIRVREAVGHEIRNRRSRHRAVGSVASTSGKGV